jgi:hypothetical protein
MVAGRICGAVKGEVLGETARHNAALDVRRSNNFGMGGLLSGQVVEWRQRPPFDYGCRARLGGIVPA